MDYNGKTQKGRKNKFIRLVSKQKDDIKKNKMNLGQNQT